jgi:hypothetical protein
MIDDKREINERKREIGGKGKKLSGRTFYDINIGPPIVCFFPFHTFPPFHITFLHTLDI